MEGVNTNKRSNDSAEMDVVILLWPVEVTSVHARMSKSVWIARGQQTNLQASLPPSVSTHPMNLRMVFKRLKKIKRITNVF